MKLAFDGPPPEKPKMEDRVKWQLWTFILWGGADQGYHLLTYGLYFVPFFAVWLLGAARLLGVLIAQQKTHGILEDAFTDRYGSMRASHGAPISGLLLGIAGNLYAYGVAGCLLYRWCKDGR